MATISVSVPDNLKNKIAQNDEVNWSAIARKAFEQKVNEIEFLKKLASKSKLSQKDADELSKTINRNIAKKFRGMWNASCYRCKHSNSYVD